MPTELLNHIRFPQDMFTVQTRMLTTYHMTDPQVYYNKEDYWEIPAEIYGSQEKPVEPYYLSLIHISLSFRRGAGGNSRRCNMIRDDAGQVKIRACPFCLPTIFTKSPNLLKSLNVQYFSARIRC